MTVVAARLNQAAFGLVGSCPQDEKSDLPALLAETVWSDDLARWLGAGWRASA